MQETILVVDDEPDVVDLVRYNLQKAGFAVVTASSGLDALQILKSARPDLIVLDLMMPGMNGIDFCREQRRGKETAEIPVIMLTARDQQRDKIAGFESGADDYVTKPFSPKELILRINALLRRTRKAPGPATLAFGGFELDKSSFDFRLNGRRLVLTTTEFRLLALLVEKRGKILSRETLLTEVWGYQNPIDTRTVDTHMRRLRAKLDDCAGWIETVRGEGYRFKVEAA